MKKILIPTDFSLKSYLTIDYVIGLFKNEHCEYYFLNTFNHSVTGLNAMELLQADDDFFEEPKEESLKQLGILLERFTVNSNNEKHTFYAVSENRDLVVGIKEHIEKIGIDLVIVSGNKDKRIGKNTKIILQKIRSCPILIVPPNSSTCEGVSLTIASDFKQKINTMEIGNFIKTLENTNFDIGIFVLEEQDTLTTQAANNLELMITYLKQLSNKQIGLEYIKPSYGLKEYATTHLDGIMCIIDTKPDLLRKMGFYKSNVISTLEKIKSNTVLTLHQ